jgi:predicted RNase H-like HicB family nuclease
MISIERRIFMEKMIDIQIEYLPEGVYLATSKDVQGLVAQGRTIWETVEIARDVAKKLLDARHKRTAKNKLRTIAKRFQYQLVLEV